MQLANDPESAFCKLFEQHKLSGLVQAAQTGGWQQVWNKFEELYKKHPFKNDEEKQVFADLFMSYCLSFINPIKNNIVLWELIDKWASNRKIPERSAAISQDEQTSSLYFCLKLRDKLRDYLLQATHSDLEDLCEHYQKLALTFWHQLFLNMFSPLNLLWDTKSKSETEQTSPEYLMKFGYPGLLAASMYHPLDADEFNIDSDALFASSLPIYCKTIIMRWMINIPYFNGQMKHRDKLVRYVPELCQALQKHPEIVTQAYYLSFIQEVMTGFWRGSYIGGNNVDALSAFGDFISATINRFCPQLPHRPPRQLKPGEKIRIGYISRNFFRQAVSYYMINRVIHQDRDKFEVFIFSLGDYKDEFTNIYTKNSHHFEKFPDLKNFSAIINSVIASNLDILIFTDIGMDVVTYILAGLRLAPIQCAMVGHGTTTGLPTIDYYISGDFEAPNAQTQYREKLIRLPNLGGAQYLPDSPVPAITRVDLGIPDDAVLFISCANGIKHREERERLYVEILKQAPNAWILLKPYTSKDGVDGKLAKRIKSLADEAGVSDRLLILPSIGHYRNVLGLLSISDVQLDTYPYGGWTTNMEALYVGLPIVTQEGELSRSRWGAGMLRALQIKEGIASNEEEYVAWAVKFAQDPELRWRISQKIKSQVLSTLFNGAAAQPSFEQALLDIMQASQNAPLTFPEKPSPSKQDEKLPLKNLGQISVVLPDRLYVATSIAPKNYINQRAALESWQKAGFNIISVNPPDELNTLQPEFPDIEFLPAPRDARQAFQKPYIYFDDILNCLAQTKANIGGIINSDVHLINKNIYDLVKKQTANSVLFGSRLDATSPDAREGKVYSLGFDFFFIHRDLFKIFPKESFCIGLPWWDFWAAIIPLQNNCAVKRVVTPTVLHVNHQAGWDKESWLTLGNTLSKYVESPFPLTPDTMINYLHHVAARINRESIDVLL